MKLPYLTFNYIFNISLTRQSLKKFFVGKNELPSFVSLTQSNKVNKKTQVKMGESFDEDKQRKRERERERSVHSFRDNLIQEILYLSRGFTDSFGFLSRVLFFFFFL